MLVLSCKKKEPSVEEAASVAPSATTAYTIKDYMPVRYANYWVYEVTVSDTNNIVQSTYVDSCIVYDSIMAHGKWFYKLIGDASIQDNYADSANCMVNDQGAVLLKLSFTGDTIYKYSYNQASSWLNACSIMNLTPTTFVYNSKTYSNCINRYTYVYSNTHPTCPNRIFTYTFCPGVGLVYAKYGFMNGCNHWEAKLLRYKIN